VAEINNSGADFLCVALGSPKQEEFLYRHCLALTNDPESATGILLAAKADEQ